MSGLEETNIAVVRRYFDGCNSGKLEDSFTHSRTGRCALLSASRLSNHTWGRASGKVLE